jgi:glycosyltransferase involved in cell wall biosynthesis
VKVLVFAHTPPPHHGQSFMVEQLLKGFADPAHGIETFHVNAHFASEIRDIGKFRFQKILLLAKHILHAVWIRFRHGVKNFYYIPAPPLKNAIVRDWIVLNICRIFFPRLILHWQAAGLTDWIQSASSTSRKLTRRAVGEADLSIALSAFNEREIEIFRPRRKVVIPNGIPDPCPDFEKILAQRQATRGPVVRVLYMSLAIREKGVFDAIRGVLRANELSEGKFKLTIAGRFFEPDQEKEFRQLGEKLPPGIV